MRRLIYSMLTSLDLFVEGPDGRFDWSVPDEELHRHFNARAAYATTQIYGRRMWEVMAPYWTQPQRDPVEIEYARYWNAAEHIVCSRTLRSVDHGARLVSDAVAEVTRLKAGDGPDLDVGGASLANELIEAGLVDEIHAYVHPIVIGGGKRLVNGRIELELLGVQTFARGAVQLRYAPRVAG
jgi:dihydrofolate reductase